MTVSSGFFNSMNHDRLYDAEQFSSVFDGIIRDGVYQSIGDAFKISANEEVANTVIVGTGRAWFDHTWTVNDTRYAIVLAPPNEALSRIDAIVLDVNREDNTRKNSILYIQGDYSSSPQKPKLVKTELHNQYPLAYISVDAGSDFEVTNADIEIAVGTSACPIVTGVLEVVNADMFLQQMDAEFNEWWDGIKDVLDENTALKLQNQIDALEKTLETVQGTVISSEDITKASNCKLNTKYLLDDYSSYGAEDDKQLTYLLPDGKIFLITLGTAVTPITAKILNTNDVYGQETTIRSGVTPPTTVSTPVYLRDRLIFLSGSFDSYPVTIYFVLVEPCIEFVRTRVYNSTGVKLELLKITISSGGIISHEFSDIAVQEYTTAVAFDGGHTDSIVSTFKTISLENGSKAFSTWSASDYEGSSGTVSICLFIMSSSNVLTKTEYNVSSWGGTAADANFYQKCLIPYKSSTNIYVFPCWKTSSTHAYLHYVKYTISGEMVSTDEQLDHNSSDLDGVSITTDIKIPNVYLRNSTVSGNVLKKNSGGHLLDGDSLSIPIIYSNFVFNPFSSYSGFHALSSDMLAPDDKSFILAKNASENVYYILVKTASGKYGIQSNPISNSNSTYSDGVLLSNAEKVMHKISDKKYRFLIPADCDYSATETFKGGDLPFANIRTKTARVLTVTLGG